ncbi:MAG: STAS domain-containing protein [Pseudazoarcus pumilus]|nr:STAS domain-containing protein [Pseudazoarcus pumilus]
MFRFHPRILDTLPGYDRATLSGDFAAGITVGVLALPLAMAFAIASGMSPAAGIWTAIVAGLLVSLLGGSRVQIGGPTGAFIPIVYAIVLDYGVANLLVATMMSGVMLFAMGAFRLGTMIRFIPISVVIGFTNGIAVVIFLSQIKDFLGLQIDQMPGEFFGKVEALSGALHTAQVPTIALAAASVSVLLAWNRAARRIHWMRRAPGPLAVLVLATLANALFVFPVDTIGSRFGGIPQELPDFGLPAVELGTLGKLVAPALTIALLGAIESLLSARVADQHIGDRHDPNQELMAQGLANLAAPLFGGFAATGAIARTATNLRSGGRTPVAGMVHAAVLLAMVLALAPLASHIPLATLSAIVVIVAINMGEWHAFRLRELRRHSRPYAATLLTTFALTVLFDLTLAVQAGLVMSALVYLYRMSDLTRLDAVDLSALPVAQHADGSPRVLAFRLSGSLFFGASHKLDALLADLGRPRYLVLDLDHMVHIDTTGLDILHNLHHDLARRGIRLMLAGLQPQPAALLRRAGFDATLGTDALATDIDDALARIARSEGQPPP